MSAVDLDPVERMLVQVACIQLGIVPVDEPTQPVFRALAKMSAEDARAAKRKFRRVFRQVLRQRLGNKQQKKRRDHMAWFQHDGTHRPNGYGLSMRRYAVLGEVYAKLKPLLDAVPRV